jgi:hypothetical protein
MPFVKFKAGVELNDKHFRKNVIRIIEVACATAPSLIDNSVVITSANDGVHMKGSKHGTNEAFDIRISNIAIKDNGKIARRWAADMQVMLGSDYDVILEKDHIHAEYDPSTQNMTLANSE